VQQNKRKQKKKPALFFRPTSFCPAYLREDESSFHGFFKPKKIEFVWPSNTKVCCVGAQDLISK
jgi:hypothetical protein